MIKAIIYSTWAFFFSQPSQPKKEINDYYLSSSAEHVETNRMSTTENRPSVLELVVYQVLGRGPSMRITAPIEQGELVWKVEVLDCGFDRVLSYSSPAAAASLIGGIFVDSGGVELEVKGVGMEDGIAMWALEVDTSNETKHNVINGALKVLATK